MKLVLCCHLSYRRFMNYAITLLTFIFQKMPMPQEHGLYISERPVIWLSFTAMRSFWDLILQLQDLDLRIIHLVFKRSKALAKYSWRWRKITFRQELDTGRILSCGLFLLVKADFSHTFQGYFSNDKTHMRLIRCQWCSSAEDGYTYLINVSRSVVQTT